MADERQDTTVSIEGEGIVSVVNCCSRRRVVESLCQGCAS